MDTLSIARINHLIDQLRPAVSSAMLGITIATMLFWQQTGSTFFFGWFCFAIPVVVAHFELYRRYNAAAEKRAYGRWLLIHRLLTASHALVWATLAVASYHIGGAVSLSFALILLTGVTAAAVTTTSADLPAFYTFSILALAPISLTLLLETELTLVWLGSMCGAYILVLLQLGHSSNTTIREALRGRIETEALSERLLEEKQRLAQAKEKAENLAAQLYELSSRDGLTGLYNRRAFDEALTRHFTQPKSLVSLLICDIDAFKSYNDHFGHLQGDACLKSVARAMLEVVTRSGDMVARYGGEEFAIILANTDEKGAGVVAERLREAVRGLSLAHPDSPVAPIVTASFGVASTASEQIMDTHDLINQADEALYQAKAQGRDQVVVAAPRVLTELVN